MGNQVLRVQQMPQIVTNRLATISNNKAAEISSKQNNTNTNATAQKTILVSSAGQTLRLQASTTAAATTTANKSIVIQNSNTQQVNVSNSE